MINLLKIATAITILFISMVSCNSKPSLQKYFVERETKDNFTIVDIPKSIIGVSENELTDVQKKAYASIKKVQLLAYPIVTGNKEEYTSEKDMVKQLLSNEQYTTIARMSSNGGKVIVTYLGEEKAIDEMIVFGYKKDMGLGVARILGDDMNAEEIFTLYKAFESNNTADSKIKDYLQLFQ